MNHINLQSVPRRRLDRSPLGPFSQRYLEHLERDRYARTTARVYLCCVAHFAHWISTERLALELIDEAARVRFISEHLPVCDCPYPARRLPHELRAAITGRTASFRDIIGLMGVHSGPASRRNRRRFSFLREVNHLIELAIAPSSLTHQQKSAS